MRFRIAEAWFEFRRADDDITLICEPHVVSLIRCNGTCAAAKATC